MNVNEYLKAEHKRYAKLNRNSIYGHARQVVCVDGFSVSVQASEAHYCSPRENAGPWDSVELGFPSEAVAEFMEYAEEPARPTDTVYGWVPVATVEAVIEAHGGMVVPE